MYGVTGLVHSLVPTTEQNMGKSIICGLGSSSMVGVPQCHYRHFGLHKFLAVGASLCAQWHPDLYLPDANSTLPLVLTTKNVLRIILVENHWYRYTQE